MRRLYIGGLGHSVTQKDLKDRFGKFGEVQDVELRTRKDDEGVPYKTFGYINIDISEADLKKCLTVLNKSKWKGGTLQIETAKESFLQRLTEERQEAEEQRLHQPATENKRQKLLNSFSKAGVENFTMKAAVPGTEVPGHKDWVVSKFGRVLPILQLRCKKGNRARTLNYDPSKYSHNIRKLDRAAEDLTTPVTQLTWEVQGGDDDISKKRRGEFPPYEPPRPKKTRKDKINSLNIVDRTRSEQAIPSANLTEAQHSTNGFKLPTNNKVPQRKLAPWFDSDSDEEIRRLVADQSTSTGDLCQVVEEDNLEVVGLDFLVKSGRSRQQLEGRPDDHNDDDYDSADTDELFASRKPPPSAAPVQEKQTLSTAKQLSGNNTDKKKKTTQKSKARTEEEADSADAEEHLTSRKPFCAQQRGDNDKPNSQKQGSSSENQSKRTAVLPVNSSFSESDSDADDEDDDDEEVESADSCSDSDYEAMFSNATCLEISFADLQRLAEESQQTSETVPSILSASPEKQSNLTSGSAERPAPKKGTMPEDILAAIMENDSSDDEKPKKKKKRKGVVATPLPAFQGTKSLNEVEIMDGDKRQEEEERGSELQKHKVGSGAPQMDRDTTKRKTSRTLSRQNHTEAVMSESSEQDEEEQEEEKKREVVKNIAALKGFEKVPSKAPPRAESSSSFSSDDEEEERTKACDTLLPAKAAAKALQSCPSSSSSSEEDEDEQEEACAMAPNPVPHSESSSSEEEEEPAPSRVTLRAKEEEELQKQANVRRLAAIQQRQKETEEHKKLIQGALSNLNTSATGSGKRIVFGSDDDEQEDDEDKQQTPSEVTASKKTLFQDSQSEDEDRSDETSADANKTVKEKLSGPQLFGGSEEEEDVAEEEDGSRFEVRPQFEGRAGQKLMELQSRFGTDTRFRMDSRFLDEDEGKDEDEETKRSMTEEDETLEEERKKNLSILQNVLGSSHQPCSSKSASKAKTFRDVSALHYDPSREEHAAFETKPDEIKESKAARRKKREEAQKVPEVSKEIYYDVSGDLKAVFGPTKDDVPEEQNKANWDREEEEEGGKKDDELTPLSPLVSADPSLEKEESGFKFSFFGNDNESETVETVYKVESIEAPKVSWQLDPRFQDSSSEDDEEGQEEEEEQISAIPGATDEATPSKTNLFFFYPDDIRLTEGPRLFCRSSQLEEQREQWEEKRNELRQEYRKKHKDARRKHKSALKS